MSYRLFHEPPARVRGWPSPDDFHEEPRRSSIYTCSARAFDQDEHDNVPLYLRSDWEPDHLEPTLPMIPPREHVHPPYPSLLTGSPHPRSGSGRDTLIYENESRYQPPMPSTQQREALLFLAKVQHHSFDTIRLRLNWHHFSDMDIREVLLEEIRFRVEAGLPMPVGVGHLALLGAAERDDDRKDMRKSGQFTGGWGDAHGGGYYRILLRPEDPSDPNEPYRQTMVSPGPQG